MSSSPSSSQTGDRVQPGGSKQGDKGSRESSNETDALFKGFNKLNISASEIQGVRRGKCKWFNVAKGWGFITPNDGGQEVFVHQSVIQMTGFRSLGEQEDVEFECQITDRGLEAIRVCGREGNDCSGSTVRPRPKKKFRRVRCYNCGEFANHIASKCQLGPQPKRCHLCKSEDHLFADCPKKRTSTAALSATSSRAREEVSEEET